MVNLPKAFGGFLRDRDFFVHDGSQLRRLRLTAQVQLLLLALTFALFAWSGYAAARLLAPGAANAASIAAATDVRARQIEQRQEILIALLAGEDVDPAKIAAAADLGELPVGTGGPLARAEEVQQAHAEAAARALDIRYRTAAAELRKLGITPARLGGGVGGPLEPVGGADPTFKQLFSNWKKLDNLHDNAIAVPSDKPVQTAAFTSGYGVRSDPFQRRSAMHAGIDLSGPVGTAIHATADGVVSDAGWNNGGYGNLIKIDHGRGIETRYAHLSKVLVSRGQRVKRGDVIARMGSTGRSTGSHLHYEVRIDGRAVNPVPFMKSTDYLLAMKRSVNAQAMDQIALGGPPRAGAR